MAGENKNRIIFRAILMIITLVIFIRNTDALTQQLTVESCSFAGCSAPGWNDFDNVADGSTLAPRDYDQLTLSNPSFDNRSTINNIIIMHHHAGTGGVKGNLEYIFRNAASTETYCNTTIRNTQAWTYSLLNLSGCNWNYTKLTDLVIVVTSSSDASKDAYNSYMNFTIDYTAYNDNRAPNISLGPPDNNSFSTISNNIFYFTPSDENIIMNCTLILNNTKNITNYDINNGTQNNITSALQDGIWSWTINCTDSWNNTGTNSSQKLIRVDTTPPKVNLESPANNTPWSSSPDVLFKFNVSDIMTNISSCELIIDNQERDTINSPLEDISLNFTFAPGNGQHNWSVNCTDGNGWKNSSSTYNMTVSYAGRTAQSDKSSYQQGENVVITGNNWNDGIVTIQLIYPNSTMILWNTTAIGGIINTDYFINYSYPSGTYNMTAYEYSTPSNNATSSFEVTIRAVNINVDKANYFQGEKIQMNGTGFSPNSLVTLTIRWVGGSNTTNISSDETGFFEYNHTLNYTATLGLYNFTAYDFYYPNLNNTANLTVNQRVANVSTDKSIYSLNENVYISGTWFTNNGTVNLTIYNNATSATAPLFPKIVYSNSTGSFSYVWNVTDTCPGVFIIKANDLNNSFLNDNTSFIITGLSVPHDYPPTASYEGDNGANTLNNLLVQNDANEESLTLGATNPNYLGMNFSYSLSPTANIDSIRFWYKHYVSDISRVTYLRLEWLNISTWQTVSGCSISTPSSSTLEYCDLDNYVKNGSQANDLKLRTYYQKSTGGTYYSYMDYAHINLTASGTATCTDWNNQPPVITSIILDDSQSSPSNQIDLNAGNTRTVYCNVTVYDYNGYATINHVNSTIYHATKISSSPDLNMSHYTTNLCSETGNNGADTKYFSCQFDVWYWALNGTWFCNATAKSNADIISKLVNSTINPLYALNVSNTIDFGIMQPMQISPADIIKNVTNIGNMVLDLGLDGYGIFDDDNIGMNCSEGNISLDSERYSLNFGQSWNSMTPLTDITSYMPSFDLNPRNDTNATKSIKEIYWKLQVDPKTRGVCNGTVVFTASAG